MAATLRLEVATPERLLLKEQVTMAEVPGLEGALGILPEHAPLLSELGCGPLTYVLDRTGRVAYVTSGQAAHLVSLLETL